MPQDKQASKRAVLYARTSVDSDSDDSSLKVSIEEQLEACRNLCQSHGYQIIGEYFGRNRSGITHRGQHTQRYRQVENRTFLLDVRRGQIDRQAFLGHLEPRIEDGGIDPVLVEDPEYCRRAFLDRRLS